MLGRQKCWGSMAVHWLRLKSKLELVAMTLILVHYRNWTFGWLNAALVSGCDRRSKGERQR